MNIKSCMVYNVIYLRSGTPIKEAAEIYTQKRIGALPILDNEDKLIGIISVPDIIQLFLPDFVSLMNIDFIKDYGALEINAKDIERIEGLKVDDVMTKDVISVDEECDIVRAISLMKKHGFRHLPVVTEGKLVGMVSNIDICRRFLEIWESKSKGE